MNVTISYLLGIIALVIWTLSIQVKEKKKILQAQIIANLFFAGQYILIDAVAAGIMNIVSAIRCYVFTKEEEKHKQISVIWLFIFVTIILCVAVVTCREFISLIPIAITIIYTYASWQKDTKVIRILFLLAACAWIYYNAYVGAYVAIIGNILDICSSIVSIFRFDKKKIIDR